MAIKPPDHLTKESKELFRGLQSEYQIDDPGGVKILQVGCEAFQRAQQARQQIDRDGMMIEDRHGQKKVNPLCAVERDARAAFLAALKALNLDIEPLRDKPGRPAGR